METKTGKDVSALQTGKPKQTLKRVMLLSSAIILVVLLAVVMTSTYLLVSARLHSQHREKLTEIVNYTENHADVEDLKNCIETGVKSATYEEYQLFLNGFIADFDIDYLYIVIPKEDRMVNVISATSPEEIAAGESDMALLEETTAYSEKDLARFRSFWDSDEIGYFEESSEYGVFFTACKPMRAADGKTIALICADIDVASVNGQIILTTVFIVGCILVAALIFAFVIGYVIRRNITGPLFLLEKSARKYAQSSVADGDAVYEAPNIKADNEVKSLGDAIKYMADSLKVKIEENFLAGRRAEDAEKENARLVEKAAAADKIARLSQSVNALLDNMPAMTFYKDIETGKYIACNQAFAKNCNKSCPEEVTGLTDHDIYDKDTADHFVALDQKAIESEGPISYFEDVSDACGRRHQYQTTKLIFTDPTGTPRLLGMCVEVTELLEMKSEKEKTEQAYKKAKDMSLTYSRIANALSLDYIFLYYIDVVTEEFIEYRSGAKGEDLAIARRGTEFFTVARKDAQDVIHKDDLQIFLSTFTKRNVLDKINALGTFTSTYRLFVDGRYAHVNMKASKLGGEDDHIIIGVSNVDAQMKDQEELERIYQESITYSRIAALSGNYIGIYTVDPETDDYIEYSATHEYEGLGLEKQGKNFFEVSVREGKRVIYFEDKEHFSSVFKKENILKEIRENGLFVVDYRLMINGVPNYVTLKAAIVEEKDGPQLIIGILNVDAQVRREQEYVRNLVAARNQADVDALTGVKNKHAYIDVEALINRNIDENADVSFAIVICDVNRLKEVNDTKGHVAGDEYIRSGCRMICEVFEHSPVFRVGGDEFVVIAQGADYDNIDALIEKLNARNKENAQKGEVVVACGMAKFDGDRNVSAVLERADILMYENKKNLKR